MTPDMIIPDLNEEEYEKAGSKFAKPGNHLSECGMPEWESPGKSIKFLFRIIEEGEDFGKENKLVAGITKGGVWKFKEMEKALGLKLMQNIDGKMTIPEDRLMACVGVKFLTVWTMQKDTRKPEEGGKGGTYTKPTGALPLGSTTKELIPDAGDSPF